MFRERTKLDARTQEKRGAARYNKDSTAYRKNLWTIVYIVLRRGMLRGTTRQQRKRGVQVTMKVLLWARTRIRAQPLGRAKERPLTIPRIFELAAQLRIPTTWSAISERARPARRNRRGRESSGRASARPTDEPRSIVRPGTVSHGQQAN